MTKILAIGATEDSGLLHTLEIERRPVGGDDVQIKVKYCGMCHSDLHHGKGEWGPATRPAVPGHEIVGQVVSVGNNVQKFKKGDIVGVGCFVNSCRKCPECTKDLVQYCSGPRYKGTGPVNTYGHPDEHEGHTKGNYNLISGGYSQSIVVTQDFVLRIPSNLDLAGVAPLLCAGITTWSPLVHYGVKKGDSVAVLGLGGLGHMGVKFAHAMGCKVTVLSRSKSKEEEALDLGADKVLITTNESEFKAASRSFDFILDTVSAKHDLNAYCGLLKTDGTLIIVGGVPEPLALSTFSLIPRRLKIGGSLVGGIKETQEMLDFCGKHNITSDIELVSCDYANKAWERMLKSDVKFRFVLDIEKTLVDGLKVDA
jgi:uncharacterized zinc-type alcohol dehydrogenase-like protein